MEWLNEHTSRKIYDANLDKVTKLYKGNLDKQIKFEKLSNDPNLVLLSRASIGKKYQTTFYHSIVGAPILPDDIHYTAKARMQSGSGIEIDPNFLFGEKDEIRAPKILDQLKVKIGVEFVALVAPTTRTMKEVN